MKGINNRQKMIVAPRRSKPGKNSFSAKTSPKEPHRIRFITQKATLRNNERQRPG